MKKMEKIVAIVLAAGFLLAPCTTVWASNRQMSPVHLRRLQAQRSTLPLGWRYEAGYTLWRMNRNLPANQVTYMRYRNDRAWHYNMRQNHRGEELLLNTIDWTVEEIASFMHRYQELLRFHPAGIE